MRHVRVSSAPWSRGEAAVECECGGDAVLTVALSSSSEHFLPAGHLSFWRCCCGLAPACAPLAVSWSPPRVRLRRCRCRVRFGSRVSAPPPLLLAPGDRLSSLAPAAEAASGGLLVAPGHGWPGPFRGGLCGRGIGGPTKAGALGAGVDISCGAWKCDGCRCRCEMGSRCCCGCGCCGCGGWQGCGSCGGCSGGCCDGPQAPHSSATGSL
mmetsp:Transcript_15835/g.40881  ORF Transcript_15835/g.40881 Transcript_15835/m.40881 type:complete len:210 (+) Transcript_15835:409-1038(+)